MRARIDAVALAGGQAHPTIAAFAGTELHALHAWSGQPVKEWTIKARAVNGLADRRAGVTGRLLHDGDAAFAGGIDASDAWQYLHRRAASKTGSPGGQPCSHGC